MKAADILQRYPASGHCPVLVTEVTRMTRGYYCVAGWDMHQRRMVRPLQATGENWRLESDRSVFRVGHVIDCSPNGQQRVGYPHATEDLPLSRTPVLLDTWGESETHAYLLPTTVRAWTVPR